MNQTDTVKRSRGRPRTGQMPVVFSRVPPEIVEVLTRESERRGVKTSTVIREALEVVFSPMINRAA
jgi:predicted DNA-binding protein